MRDPKTVKVQGQVGSQGPDASKAIAGVSGSVGAALPARLQDQARYGGFAALSDNELRKLLQGQFVVDEENPWQDDTVLYDRRSLEEYAMLSDDELMKNLCFEAIYEISDHIHDCLVVQTLNKVKEVMPMPENFMAYMKYWKVDESYLRSFQETRPESANVSQLVNVSQLANVSQLKSVQISGPAGARGEGDSSECSTSKRGQSQRPAATAPPVPAPAAKSAAAKKVKKSDKKKS